MRQLRTGQGARWGTGRCVMMAAVVAGTLMASMRVAGAQTLARPGWAGSGLTVAAWWKSAVMFEVTPARSPAAGGAVAGHELTGLIGRLDDLQALGADAVLLREVDRPGAPGANGRVAEAYGTLDQFDDLLREASRRRIRVVVELPGSLDGDALRGAARFWLSRGVSGIYLHTVGGDTGVAGAAPAANTASATAAPASADAGAAQVQLLHELLRGYAGERVLLVDGGADSRAGAPEITSIEVRGFVAGQPVDVTAVRQGIAAARALAGGRRGGTMARIDGQAGVVTGAEAEARASVLLMVAGGVALRAGEVGEGPGGQAIAASQAQEAKDQAALAAATSPAGISNVKRAMAARAKLEPPRFAGDAVFQWTERMIGLHRGNPAMLQGEQTLLDHDRDGAVVSVWRGRAGQVLCEVVNLRDAPTEFSLAQEFAGMGLRGGFLKPVARTDAGMGAMPLGRVKLPGFRVFVGELGR